jgi:HlyD family secretion protein
LKILLRLVIGVVLAGGLIAILAANFQRDPEFSFFKWKMNREAPTEVKFAKVNRARITRTIEAPGKVEADIEVKISSQVVGRIVKLRHADGSTAKEPELIKEGDPIKKGIPVVELDPMQYRAEVRSAEAKVRRLRASIESAESDLTKSERDMDRSRRLFASRATSQTELADLETLHTKEKHHLAMAKAELIEAEAALDRVKEDLLHTTIASPIDGIVSQLLAKEGEMVVIGTMNNAGTVIMTISDPNTRVVRARIDENNISLVREGQKAVVHLQNNETLSLTGKVLRISPKGIKPGSAVGTPTTAGSDNDVAIFETIIALDSPPPEVRLGMNANVEIQVDERDNVLSVPSQAILHRQVRDLPAGLVEQVKEETPKGGGIKDPMRRYHQVVFVEFEGNAKCKVVKTGISDESRVQIISGLEEGETVITGPYRVFEKLKDSKPVKEMTENDDGAGQ